MTKQNNGAPLVSSEGSAQKIDEVSATNLEKELNMFDEQAQYTTESDPWVENENDSQSETTETQKESAPVSIDFSFNRTVLNGNLSRETYGRGAALILENTPHVKGKRVKNDETGEIEIKKEENFSQWTYNNTTVKGDHKKFMQLATEGYGVAGATFLNGQKVKEEFNDAQFCPIDWDNATPTKAKEDKKRLPDGEYLPIEELQADPFWQQYGLGIYLTRSHKPEWHRYRGLFCLDRVCTTWQEFEAASKYLASKFKGVDPSSKDPARAFYGNNGRKYDDKGKEIVEAYQNPLIFVREDFTTLPDGFVDEAIAWAEAQNQQGTKTKSEPKPKAEPTPREQTPKCKAYTKDTDADRTTLISLLETMRDAGLVRSQGGGTYPYCKIVYAVVAHFFEDDIEEGCRVLKEHFQDESESGEKYKDKLKSLEQKTSPPMVFRSPGYHQSKLRAC
jgi:hypothetical protein